MDKYIRGGLKVVAGRGQKLFALDRLLLKQSTIEAINQIYIDFWFEFDSFPNEVDVTESMGIQKLSDGGIVELSHHYTPNTTKSYEELSEIANDFGYGNSIRHKVTIERTIGGFEFFLADHRDAPIPEEDMKLLMMLGKTKTDVTEATVSTNIFCEFNSHSTPDIPF